MTLVQFLIKTIISALIIAGVSELGKRFTPLAAVLASLPLTSILAAIWLYKDTQDVNKVADLTTNIFWAVLPSLLFFVTFPLLLKAGLKFGWAMTAACVIMFVGYSFYAFIIGKFGIKI